MRHVIAASAAALVAACYFVDSKPPGGYCTPCCALGVIDCGLSPAGCEPQECPDPTCACAGASFVGFNDGVPCPAGTTESAPVANVDPTQGSCCCPLPDGAAVLVEAAVDSPGVDAPPDTQDAPGADTSIDASADGAVE